MSPTELTSLWKWFNHWCLITRMMEKPPVKLTCSSWGCLTPLVFCRQQGVGVGRPRPYLTSLRWSHGASAFLFPPVWPPSRSNPWPTCFCMCPIYKLQSRWHTVASTARLTDSGQKPQGRWVSRYCESDFPFHLLDYLRVLSESHTSSFRTAPQWGLAIILGVSRPVQWLSQETFGIHCLRIA